jgi:hypothetical protein
VTQLPPKSPPKTLNRLQQLTFALRGQHTWPPEITAYPSWSESYAAMARNMEMPIIEVEAAAAAVRAFIARIQEA